MKYCFIFLLSLFCNALFAQSGYNGGFEQVKNDLPAKWTIQSNYNEYKISCDSFHFAEGCRSMRITTLKQADLAAFLPDLLVFQEYDIAKYSPRSELRMVCYLLFEKGDTSHFQPLINGSFACTQEFKQTENEKRLSAKPVIINNRQWIKYEATGQLSGDCRHVMFGFVVQGEIDLFIDRFEIYVNGKLVR